MPITINPAAIGVAGLVLLLLLILAVRLVRSRQRRIRREANPRKITLRDIDLMEDGSEFELYLFRLFSELGYSEVYQTTASRDFGADLVFTDREGRRHVLQAKRYSYSNPVGLGAVQEVYTSMRYYEAERAIVLTSGRYTEACRTLAAVNGVKLLDREDLEDLISLFKGRRYGEAMNVIEELPEIKAPHWRPRKNQR
ncbi:restriction endonuclease [Paenibacillus sp. JX-17]|uniref:Restriction endonuclease n=1 Tax=Paenibacillus lacisoli TaxID=3064525 RepID=A0ABT9CHQ7_9BACL|nr:restriction endonuclease [Paenibacillus sp. JX-17]MDO7908790.1 restriction endonuclease [Paenibacillus sp. JX-17]